MNRQLKENRRGPFIVAAGWLFADLLLALAMLFLAANTLGIHPPPPTPKPKSPASPTHVVATPTPTPQPRLELSFHEFKITIDPNGLLSGSQGAVNAVIQQVKGQPFLQGRNAGLIIVYGGAPGDGQISTAQAVANKIYDVLRGLGRRGDPLFNRTSYYNALYLLGGQSNIAVVDMYLFAR